MRSYTVLFKLNNNLFTEKRQSIKQIDTASLRYPELDSRQQFEPERVIFR